MKKYLLSILSAIILFSATAMAQPTLTAAGINPVIGDVYTFKFGEAIDPGNSGINQTWDLSSANTGTYTQTYNAVTPVVPPNSPYSPSTVGLQNGGGTDYYITSNNSLMYNGRIDGVFAYCTNTEVMLSFPFNYQDSLSDPWQVNYNIGIGYNTGGITFTTYDGYGTLMIPGGVVYNNVVRVHYRKIYEEYNIPNTMPPIRQRNTFKDGYKWYLNGNHQAVAETYTVHTTSYQANNNVVMDSISSLILLSNSVSSTNEFNQQSSISFYPNPVLNELTIGTKDGHVISKIEIIDSSGKAVYKQDNRDANHLLKIDVSNFKPGLYIARFITENGSVSTKKITILGL